MCVETQYSKSLPGIARHIFYTDVNMSDLASGDRQLSAQFSVKAPYFEFTNQDEAPLYKYSLTGGVILTIGRIGSFTDGQLSTHLHEQIGQYIEGGTMGNYPKDNLETNLNLLASMMGGFSPDRLVVTLEHHTKSGIATLAGVQAQRGLSDITQQQGLEDATGSLSTLSTYSSLFPTELGRESEQYKKFLTMYGSKPETQAVTMSRLYRRPKTLINYTSDEHIHGMSGLCMAALAVGITQSAKEHQSGQITNVVFDTHLSGLKQMLINAFSMQIVVNSGQVTPTTMIKKSVLHSHYAPSADGGFLDEIAVGVGEIAQYSHLARRDLESIFGLKIDL